MDPRFQFGFSLVSVWISVWFQFGFSLDFSLVSVWFQFGFQIGFQIWIQNLGPAAGSSI